MTWEDFSDEISKVRRRSMLSSAMVCNCVWMLGHGLLLVYRDTQGFKKLVEPAIISAVSGFLQLFPVHRHL